MGKVSITRWISTCSAVKRRRNGGVHNRIVVLGFSHPRIVVLGFDVRYKVREEL